MGRRIQTLLAMNREPEDFDHFTSDQVSAFLRHIPQFLLEACFRQQIDPVAADHGFSNPTRRLRQEPPQSILGPRFAFAEVQSNALTSSIASFWQVSSFEISTAGCRFSLSNGNMNMSHCLIPASLIPGSWEREPPTLWRAGCPLEFRSCCSSRRSNPRDEWV